MWSVTRCFPFCAPSSGPAPDPGVPFGNPVWGVTPSRTMLGCVGVLSCGGTMLPAFC